MAAALPTRVPSLSAALRLLHQHPDALEGQFGLQLIGHLVVVFQDRRQKVAGVPQSNRKEAGPGLGEHDGVEPAPRNE